MSLSRQDRYEREGPRHQLRREPQSLGSSPTLLGGHGLRLANPMGQVRTLFHRRAVLGFKEAGQSAGGK